MMTPRLSLAITLRIATRAAIDRNDDLETVRLNALADLALMQLCPHEQGSYRAWAFGPPDAPVRLVSGASA